MGKKGLWKAGALLLGEFDAWGELRWWVIVSAEEKGQVCWPGKVAGESGREWLLECAGEAYLRSWLWAIIINKIIGQTNGL